MKTLPKGLNLHLEDGSVVTIEGTNAAEAAHILATKYLGLRANVSPPPSVVSPPPSVHNAAPTPTLVLSSQRMSPAPVNDEPEPIPVQRIDYRALCGLHETETPPSVTSVVPAHNDGPPPLPVQMMTFPRPGKKKRGS